MAIGREQAMAGQAIYTKPTLHIYDWYVLRFSNRLAWRCSANKILDWYNRYIGSNHLDVGVGTGYFLDHCRFPSLEPRVALLDLNGDCLDYARRRIARYRPEVYHANVLEPISATMERFDSIGFSYLLHCLPGTMHEKAVAFDHVKKLLNPGGVVFGATILHEGVEKNRLARTLLDIYNRKAVFSNTGDDLQGLEKELKRRFTRCEIEVIGCVALFAAQ